MSNSKRKEPRIGRIERIFKSEDGGIFYRTAPAGFQDSSDSPDSRCLSLHRFFPSFGAATSETTMPVVKMPRIDHQHETNEDHPRPNLPERCKRTHKAALETPVDFPIGHLNPAVSEALVARPAVPALLMRGGAVCQSRTRGFISPAPGFPVTELKISASSSGGACSKAAFPGLAGLSPPANW